jgi:uncharacterized membrane protein YfcA
MKSVLQFTKKNKRGQINTLTGSILAIALASIVMVFTIVIQQELRDTQTTGTDAFRIANSTLVATGTFADFWPLIILAVVVGVVLGILLGVFGGRSQR